jgi:hypothetical protein
VVVGGGHRAEGEEQEHRTTNVQRSIFNDGKEGSAASPYRGSGKRRAEGGKIPVAKVVFGKQGEFVINEVIAMRTAN